MKGTSHVGHRIEPRSHGRPEQLRSCTTFIERQGFLSVGAHHHAGSVCGRGPVCGSAAEELADATGIGVNRI